MSKPTSVPQHHLITHEAMKTTYSLRICCEDQAQATSIASECAFLIDELEQKLSRYFVGGDVFAINRMKAGETLRISEECHECLLDAMIASIHTGGLFDPTLGTMIEHRKKKLKGDMPAPVGQLVVHPDTPAVTCQEPGRIIDLGGIGKGYTLDKLKNLILDAGADGALLSSGASTHLAIGEASWPIDLTGEREVLRVDLKNAALSASGTIIQGSHIVHHDHSRLDHADQPTHIWSRSSSASFSDAWSTALMLMTPQEIEEAPSAEKMLDAVYVELADGFNTFSAS